MFPIPYGQVATFRLDARDDNETSRPAHGSITVDNPAIAYMAIASNGTYCLVPRGTLAAGATAPVSVLVDAINDRSEPLPGLTIPFQVEGPPLPPAATHLVISEGPTARSTDIGFPLPADPGAPITF